MDSRDLSRYIILLRGINVSGKNLIRMADLKSALESQGSEFFNVRTYIQSGNIILESAENRSDLLRERVEKIISDSFGLEVPALVLIKDQLGKILKRNPFLKTSDSTDFLYITLLSDQPEEINIEKLNTYSYPPDEFVISTNVVYLNIPQGAGSTKLTNKFIESKLKVAATTRNWRTCIALMEMC